MTTVKTTGLPVRYVPFPAITICGLGSVEKVMADMLWGQAVDFVQQKKGVDVSETAIDLPWDQALESNGIDPSDFIAAEYPSMEEDPTELFSILVSRNPRSILLSEYAFQSACTNETRAEAEALEAQVQANPAQFCPTGTVFDERLPYCYSVIRIQTIALSVKQKNMLEFQGVSHLDDLLWDDAVDACYENYESVVFDGMYEEAEFVLLKSVIENSSSRCHGKYSTLRKFGTGKLLYCCSCPALSNGRGLLLGFRPGPRLLHSIRQQRLRLGRGHTCGNRVGRSLFENDICSRERGQTALSSPSNASAP